MKNFLTLFCLLIAPCFLSAQTIMQMEKYGVAKTKKFYTGYQLSYKLQGENDWYEGTLDQIILDRNIVVFDNRYVKLEGIEAIRTYQNRGWSRVAAINLYTFGLAWTVFSIGSSFVKTTPPDLPDPYTWGDAAVTGTSVGVGYLIQQIFKHNTYKMNKKRKLRILDMTLVPAG